MNSNAVTSILRGRGRFHQREKAEIGMMLPKAEECQQSPEAARVKEWILSYTEPLEGTQL